MKMREIFRQLWLVTKDTLKWLGTSVRKMFRSARGWVLGILLVIVILMPSSPLAMAG